MYNVDPRQLVQMIKSGQNPQQLMINILQSQMGGTPMGANLIQMAKNGNGKGIEQIARNLAQQQGIDFDKELMNFKKNLGL